MKRGELLRYLRKQNCDILREGSKHTIIVNRSNNETTAMPRGDDIARGTIRSMCKRLEIPVPF